MKISNEVYERLRQRLRRTDLTFEGNLGVDTTGWLTDEGVNQLVDAMTLEHLEIVEEA